MYLFILSDDFLNYFIYVEKQPQNDINLLKYDLNNQGWLLSDHMNNTYKM